MKLLGSMEIVDNALYIGGISAVELAEQYKTPLYVMDEQLIRNQCKRYHDTFKVAKGKNRVAYAGKAFLTLAMCQIVESEGLCLDVVSGGELFTAQKAGFPMDKVYFHGNNKTEDEIVMGVESKVGRFVVDNYNEMELIDSIAGERGQVQEILLRLTPGIEAHTHDYIKTGQIDSKFGFTPLENGIMNAVKKAISLPNVELAGIHCHIGSQIFETQPFEDAVDVMMEILADIKAETGHDIAELDLGGGFGIYYTEWDDPLAIEDFCAIMLSRAAEKSEDLGIRLPALTIEPGRSIVGNSGTTLYTVGSIKEVPGIRKYVAVDGGMTDNIRPSLYDAEYECAICTNMESVETETVTIAGKCCESGDILIKDFELPKAESGDVLAVFGTGAYGYSMASNYNKIPRAAVVLVNSGTSKLIVQRESYEDLLRNEIML
ncbi:MAG TPA: diaminopimelate decarboxylase [Clostridiaceae bacterium]|nr:diaminopimelate decarboxylase [Clostridiaceae bacterium]